MPGHGQLPASEPPPERAVGLNADPFSGAVKKPSPLDAVEEMLDYYPIVDSSVDDAVASAQLTVDAWEHRSLWRRLLSSTVDDRALCVADAEHSIAAQLSSLGPEWHWLHAMRAGERGANIDEVVIAPAGVFTINTVTESNAKVLVKGERYLVDGQDMPRIRENRQAARRATELLSSAAGFGVPVCAVVCVAGAERGFKVMHQPEHRDVVVLPRRRLAEFLLAQRAIFSADQVDRIFAVGRRLTTWNVAEGEQ